MTVAVGAAAPDFTLPDTDGGRVHLGSLVADGPVALFFFKEGCPTSDLAAPAMERLWREHREHRSPENSRLLVIGVAQETPVTATRCIEQFGWSFPVVVDTGLAASRAYDLDSTPTLVLVRGRDRLRHDGDVVTSDPPRIVDVVEGWSRDGYQGVADEIAALIGALPLDEWLPADAPPTQPG